MTHAALQGPRCCFASRTRLEEGGQERTPGDEVRGAERWLDSGAGVIIPFTRIMLRLVAPAPSARADTPQASSRSARNDDHKECGPPQLSEGEATGLPKPKRTAAIAAVLAAMVLAVLDAAIVNVALPTIAESLQASPGASVWIITAYQTALVMGLLPCAALGESLGFRRVFTMGVALFTAASALCALSPSLPWLVAARFLQGLGAAAVMALGIALLRLIVPHHRLGAAIGWNALAVAEIVDGASRPLCTCPDYAQVARR